MEIVTYLVDGALQHKDSIGGGGVIRPGEIQRMSAGRGIVHSEFNASRERTAHLLQIWIMPSKAGLEPSYEQKTIDPAAIHNRFGRIAAPDPAASEVRLVQDAQIWSAKLDKDVEAVHRLASGRRAWLQVVSGEVAVGDKTLKAGDAAAITEQDKIAVRATAPSEMLLFDLA
jgi:redox-sensitive bicupin YhaK (pirin superfamily)